MVIGIQEDFKQNFHLPKMNTILFFFAGIFLLGASLNSSAQCKKSSSSCNLTTLRNAFTTKGFQELGCGADSCSIYFISGTARTNATADSVAKSLGANLVSFQNIYLHFIYN